MIRGRRTVGLLGGSFNPAHGGHRRISLFAKHALALDEVWWVVSPGNVLKPAEGMAPLPARLASARGQARRAPIRPTAIEAQLGTRYTVDTLTTLVRRYPKLRFVWLMGTDNLAQFHHWRHWRVIARTMPIAVIARPRYDAKALASPAMVWLRRFRRRPGWLAHEVSVHSASWSAPALIILRFDPDPRSATTLRAADPQWHLRFAAASQRDPVTHRPISRSIGDSGR